MGEPFQVWGPEEVSAPRFLSGPIRTRRHRPGQPRPHPESRQRGPASLSSLPSQAGGAIIPWMTPISAPRGNRPLTSPKRISLVKHSKDSRGGRRAAGSRPRVQHPPYPEPILHPDNRLKEQRVRLNLQPLEPRLLRRLGLQGQERTQVRRPELSLRG
jgi:hypothetical protein